MFGILQVSLGLVHLGIDVAVGHQDVEPTVIVHVEEAHAPAQQAGVYAESARISAIFEDSVAEIGVKRSSQCTRRVPNSAICAFLALSKPSNRNVRNPGARFDSPRGTMIMAM